MIPSLMPGMFFCFIVLTWARLKQHPDPSYEQYVEAFLISLSLTTAMFGLLILPVIYSIDIYVFGKTMSTERVYELLWISLSGGFILTAIAFFKWKNQK